MRSRAASWVVIARHGVESTEPTPGFVDEALGLGIEPLPSALQKFPGAIDINARRTGDLIDVEFLEMLG